MKASRIPVHLPPAATVRRALICVSAILLLSGCGSESNDTPAGQNPAAIETDVLQRNAADNASSAIGTSIDTMLQSLVSSVAINTTLSSPGIAQFFMSDEQPMADDPNGNQILDDDLGGGLDDNIGSLLRATLGLKGSAESTRTGNRITIDPDEQSICEEQLVNAMADPLELQRCVDLIGDLTVQIDATTDQSGAITYYFRNEEIVLINYAPSSGSYELKLAGAKTLLERIAELDSDADPVPETMRGAVRLSASVLNDTVGSEAVNFSVSITEALAIESSIDGTDISIAPSTLFSVSADENAGTASVEVNIGPLQISSTDDDGAGGIFLNTLSMAGLTVRADLSNDGSVLNVSNLGIGSGPLTVSVNSTELVRITLETFGFSVSETDGQIRFNGDLDLSVAANNTLQYLDDELSADYSAQYTLAVPDGSVMIGQQNESLQVLSGGPVDFNYNVIDGSSSTSGSVSVAAGACFGSPDDPDAESPIVSTSCTD